MNLAKYIDHTLLKPEASIADYQKLFDEAKEHNFFSVCVPSMMVPTAKVSLKKSNVKICTVVGFPHGNMSTENKQNNASWSLENGAHEIDMVMNISYAKSDRWDLVEKDISLVKSVCKKNILKVIIETSSLTLEEKVKATHCVEKAGADFIKTSTGFAKGGAQLEDILLFKKESNLLIKASGGIRDFETAQKFIEAGASRLGTSQGVALVNQQPLSKDQY